MKQVELTWLCSLNMGQSPGSSTYNEEGKGLPFFQGNADFGEIHPKTRIWCSDPIKIANAGDILISVRAPIGAMNIAAEQCCIGRGLAALTPHEDKCNRQYLYYAIQSRVKELIAQGTGSTFKAISKKVLETTLIPVYPLEKQAEIVMRLQKIDSAIRVRRKQQKLLDTLTKARFLEIFGDPQANSMNWNIATIGDVISSCEAGWSGNGKQKEKKSGEIAVLKVSAVTKGYFIPEECKVLDDQNNIKKYIYPQKGDLLFSRANTREMVGATAIIQKDYPEHILPDKLWRIRFAANNNVYYMKYILSSKAIRDRFSAESTGTSGSMYNVSMEKFRSVQIPIPPLELQEQFAAFVQQVDKSKSAIQKSLNELQTLFDSLMQEYFG